MLSRRKEIQRFVTWSVFVLTVLTIIGAVEGARRAQSDEAYLASKNAAAEQWIDKRVNILMSLPTREVIVQQGDSPCRIYQRNGLNDTVYSQEAIVADFERRNPGARLWPGDIIIAPYRAMDSDKVARK